MGVGIYDKGDSLMASREELRALRLKKYDTALKMADAAYNLATEEALEAREAIENAASVLYDIVDRPALAARAAAIDEARAVVEIDTENDDE